MNARLNGLRPVHGGDASVGTEPSYYPCDQGTDSPGTIPTIAGTSAPIDDQKCKLALFYRPWNAIGMMSDRPNLTKISRVFPLFPRSKSVSACENAPAADSILPELPAQLVQGGQMQVAWCRKGNRRQCCGLDPIEALSSPIHDRELQLGGHSHIVIIGSVNFVASLRNRRLARRTVRFSRHPRALFRARLFQGARDMAKQFSRALA